MANNTYTQSSWWPHLKMLSRGFVLALLCLVMVRVLVVQVPQIGSPMLQRVAAGALEFLAVLTGFAALACCLIGAVRWATATNTPPPSEAGESAQQESLRLLRSINDRLLLSDAAKAIAYRERDRDALRGAIREDIVKGELDAAMMLVKQMSHLHGYHEEAEEFREQIQRARSRELELKVTQAIDRLEQVLQKQEWEKATAEAAKIQRQFPDSPRVKNLSRRVTEAKQWHKRNLERQFLEAAQRDDVDLAMELLREMDKYLTEREAEPFRETARGVIGKKRDNLGVQFKLALQDKEWTSAARVGEQIIREFPNSKMAEEARKMLDKLRQRAADQQAARV